MMQHFNSIFPITFLVCFLMALNVMTAQNRLFYVGNSGVEIFNDVVQLSDGTVLIAGAADDLNWLPAGANIIDLGDGGITNNQGSGRFAFLLQTDSTLENVLNVVHITQGGAEDIRFIKTTNAPRTTRVSGDKAASCKSARTSKHHNPSEHGSQQHV